MHQDWSVKNGIHSPIPEDDRAVKVLYVAGYGRSGSTVVATVLGNHPDMVSVGEVSFLFDDLLNLSRVCSCGLPYTECDFWRQYSQACQSPRELARLTRRVECLQHLLRLYSNRVSPGVRQVYRSCQKDLLSYVVEQTGGHVVVDSSKSAWATVGRFLALERIAGCDVYVLHLVRSGHSTLDSLVSKGRNWVLEGREERTCFSTLRGVTGWLVANLAVSALRRCLSPERYLRIRYEDFLADPKTTIRRVGDFIEVDTEPFQSWDYHNQEFEVGHVVGGNRLRFNRTVKIALGRSRAAVLRRHQRWLFGLLAGWLNKRYGYERCA